MKKFLRVGKRTLSIVLTVMMIASSLFVGTITTANAADTSPIYVDISNSGWNAIKIWAWDDSQNFTGGSWPGASMTSVGNSVYSYDLNTAATYVIFNNNNNGSQTGTQTLSNVASGWATTEKIAIIDSSNGVEWQNYNQVITYSAGTGMNAYGTVTATNSGTTVASGTTVPYNTSVTFKATANTGYSFEGWYSTADCTDTAVNSNAEYTTTVKSDTTLYAKFTAPDYIYLKNKANWSYPCAYFYNSSNETVGTNWPGSSMEAIEGTDFYRIVVPDGAYYYIFSDNAGSQTADKQTVSDKVGKVYNNGQSEWYSLDTSAKYSITGTVSVAGDWNTSTSITNLVNSEVGVYSIDVSVTSDDNKYFRIKSGDTNYSPSSTDGDYDITQITTATNAYEAFNTDTSYAFYFSETGNYTIYVCDAYVDNAIPDIWVKKNSEITNQNYTVTYGVSSATSSMGTLTATVDSGAEVTSGTSVTFTATPNANYYVEGWYSDSACTTKLNSSTANEITLSITADTEVYVKFTDTEIITPPGNAPVLHKYAPFDGDGTVESHNKTDLLNDEMTYHNDGTYEFYYYHITDGGKYLYNITLDGTTYFKGVSQTSQYADSVYLSNSYSSLTNIFETGNGLSSYYIVYTPANDADKRISVVTTFPDPTPKYSVTINNGIESRLNGTMGTSYLDGVSGQTSIKKTYDDLSVMFTTKTTDKVDSTFDFSGKMYQVYGYSVLMTLTDSSGKEYTQVTGIVNPLGNTDSDRPISALGNGVYQYSHTFPSNIKSAVVTPVYTVSDEYAKAKGITFTTVYLKSEPGSSVFGGTYEPQYYTWRKKADDDATGIPYTVTKNNRVLEREPEGAWDGQTMLHSNDDMYIAYVQSDIEGIVFNNGTANQTYDFDEFIKLQKLGYDNITFEPKSGSGNTVSGSINTMVINGEITNGSVTTYSGGQSVTLNNSLINSDFELDVDIEGYYIDVFGDRLTDTNGNEIYRPAFLMQTCVTTVDGELTALLEKTGKENEIYGARYGWYTTTDDDYGMEYAIRNYYIDGTSHKIISQQISGYGTIEGAISPEKSSMNNAEYMVSKNDKLTYYSGAKGNYTLQQFTTGYELIPESYKGLPYLVSYKQRSNVRATGEEKDQSDAYRIDGKWYYMSKTPQITVDAKVGLMNADGTIEMNGDIIAVKDDTIGSAYVNGLTSDTFDQGSSATLSASAAVGYKYVGFYQADGTFISTSNPYSSVFSSSTTIYAVFQAIEKGSLVVTNNVYGSLTNPVGGGGNGSVTVKLIVTPYDAQTQTYGTPVTVSGTNYVSYTIKDDDIFQYVITGTPSGIDKFLTFRLAETLEDGSVYNSPLDDPDCLSNDGTTYTYTSYPCVWNWYDQTGSTESHSHAINLYSDFSKTSIYVKLQYKYLNRFGVLRTYIKNNVLLTEERGDDIENYTPSNQTIMTFAPPIDEVFTSCTWKIDSKTLTQNGSVITLSAIQEPKKFWTYVDIGNPNFESKEDYFNTVVSIDAPKTNSEGENFSYWVRFLTDANGNVPLDGEGNIDVSKGEIFSYYSSTQIRVTFNSYYLAVYGETVSDFTTNLQDAIYTREKFTNEDGTVTDYVYADFLLQFEANGSDTFKNIVNNSEPGSIKFGIVREINQAAAPYDGTTLVAPTVDEELVKSTILAKAANLDPGKSVNSWCNTNDNTSPQYNHYYYINDLTDRVDLLTTFGRYDFYYRFDNTEANRSKVYNVYTYIIYTDKDGNQQIVISNPKVMNIYESGIKEDGTTVA